MKYILAILLSIIITNPVMAFEPKVEPAPNQEIKGNETSYIKLKNAYAFATMPGATTGAAFMEIENVGNTADKLIGAKSNISKITEIHQNMIDPDDGTMMMRKIKNLDIPAKTTVLLKPKGYHVMFIKMTEPLIIGKSFPVTLIFEKAGEVKTSVSIVAPGLVPKEEKKMPWTEDSDKKISEESAKDTQEKPLEERIDY